MYAFKNESHTHLPNRFFSACKFGDKLVPVERWVYWDVSKAWLISCVAPPFEGEGALNSHEVEVGIIVNDTMRYLNYGRIYYSYTDTIQDDATSLSMCVVFKDKARYLREWIAFHTIFGVSKFYLYDQGSTDQWKYAISDYIQQGLVVTHDWYFDWLTPSIRHQSMGLWHCVRNYGSQTKWMGFIDVDEFMFMPKKGERFPSIVDLLKEFEDFGGVMVDRVNFGPNGHIKRPPGLVIENYTQRAGNKFSNLAVKSIVQPKHVEWAGCGGVHTFKMQKPFLNVDSLKRLRSDGCGIPGSNITVDPLRINHYFTKSLEDWEERLQWDANPYPVQPEGMLQWPYFNEEDYDIVEYAKETERRMKFIP